MKKSLLLILVLFLSISIHAQSNSPQQLATTAIPNKDAKFLLFPTQNIHIFLKLNTRTGEVYMVQYSLDGLRGEVKIDSYQYPLVTKTEETNGRFFLYPTTNIFNFMLLDQIDGRVWQVQWNFDEDKRMVSRVYSTARSWKFEDGIMKHDLEFRDYVYLKDGELFDGVAFLDADRTVGQTYSDGRLRFHDSYKIYHNNGILATFIEDGKMADNYCYDEKENSISKEEFETQYFELLQKAKKIINGIKPNNEQKKTPVASKRK